MAIEADPSMSATPPPASPAPPAPEAPRPFARWATILQTLAVLAVFGAGSWVKRTGADQTGGDGTGVGHGAGGAPAAPATAAPAVPAAPGAAASVERRHPRLRYVEGAALGIGLVAAGLLRARRRRPRPAAPALPAPWPRGELYAAIVRCLFWSFLLAIVVASVMAVVKHPPAAATITAVVYALGLVWTARLVFRRWGLSWRDSLGAPRPGGGAELALTTLAAVGMCRVGTLVIGVLAALAGSRLPTADLPPPLDPGARVDLALAIAGAVVLAPLAEELLFRRAIFTRFRRNLSAPAAAVASALLFAIPHGYAPVGLAMMIWIGLVTAWAFHRTGSLWPSIGAHAFSNAIAIWASVT